jgi:hypothetical protein
MTSSVAMISLHVLSKEQDRGHTSGVSNGGEAVHHALKAVKNGMRR